jgi:hypothetical protein
MTNQKSFVVFLNTKLELLDLIIVSNKNSKPKIIKLKTNENYKQR